MAITFDEMKLRVQQNVEDISGDVYSSNELEDLLNDAKDQVLALIRVFSDEFPQTDGSVVFAAGEREKALPADFLKLLRAESTPSGSTLPFQHFIDDFRSQDHFSATNDMYIRAKADGTYMLGRRWKDSALTVTVWYVVDVSDVTAGATYTFGPPPSGNLIIVKATVGALASRGRRTVDWLQREFRMEQSLQEILVRLDDSGPRYVNADSDISYGYTL